MGNLVPVIISKDKSMLWALSEKGDYEIGLDIKMNTIRSGEAYIYNPPIPHEEWIESNLEQKDWFLFTWLKEKDFTIKRMKRLYPELWL